VASRADRGRRARRRPRARSRRAAIRHDRPLRGRSPRADRPLPRGVLLALPVAACGVIALPVPADAASAAPAASAPLTASASSTAPAASAASEPGWAPTGKRARVARVVVPTAVRERPGDGKRTGWLGTQARWTGGPVRLLVLAGARDRAGGLWLKVRLPARPNTAAGWIDADHARTATTRWRIRIRTRARTVAVYRDGRLKRRFGAVVGEPSTPTPHGLFAIWEKDRQPDPGGFLGPWALHLTAHSNVLRNYGGGPGRVAIHGRAGASLLDPLGTARSHGCVRVDNTHVGWMARTLGPGTPVRVTR
jgi:lipoprotein-anchoring transpeptidase ErfK/SrfK